MIRTENLLDPESLTRLAGLAGGTWRFFAGPNVSDWLTDVSIPIVTDGLCLTIGGEVIDLDFEGEDDTYSTFRVDEDTPELEAAEKSGHVYYLASGQTIEGRGRRPGDRHGVALRR